MIVARRRDCRSLGHDDVNGWAPRYAMYEGVSTRGLREAEDTQSDLTNIPMRLSSGLLPPSCFSFHRLKPASKSVEDQVRSPQTRLK